MTEQRPVPLAGHEYHARESIDVVNPRGNTREGPAYPVREMTEERLIVIQVD